MNATTLSLETELSAQLDKVLPETSPGVPIETVNDPSNAGTSTIIDEYFEDGAGI